MPKELKNDPNLEKVDFSNGKPVSEIPILAKLQAQKDGKTKNSVTVTLDSDSADEFKQSVG